MSRVTIQRR